MRQAEVFTNDVFVGVLCENDNGTFTFRYDEAFLLNNEQNAVSLSFPKRQKEFHSSILFPFFFNMLSEGANKTVQCETLKIDENDDFGLLLATAHTDTIGAVTIRRV